MWGLGWDWALLGWGGLSSKTPVPWGWGRPCVWVQVGGFRPGPAPGAAGGPGRCGVAGRPGPPVATVRDAGERVRRTRTRDRELLTWVQARWSRLEGAYGAVVGGPGWSQAQIHLVTRAGSTFRTGGHMYISIRTFRDGAGGQGHGRDGQSRRLGPVPLAQGTCPQGWSAAWCGMSRPWARRWPRSGPWSGWQQRC